MRSRTNMQTSNLKLTIWDCVFYVSLLIKENLQVYKNVMLSCTLYPGQHIEHNTGGNADIGQTYTHEQLLS